jgi:hypothetical protein
MLLKEMFGDYSKAYEDPSEDQSIPTLKDLRKVKLTLGHINQLRKIEDVRTYELAKGLEDIQRQYGVPAEGGGGMM